MRPSARPFFNGVCGRGDQNRQIERFENSMRSDDRALQHVVLIRDVPNRLKQKPRILNEGDETAEGQRAAASRDNRHTK